MHFSVLPTSFAKTGKLVVAPQACVAGPAVRASVLPAGQSLN